ncbi:MAG: Glu/Leu/Phe/Val dehydrogenase dimerization domain-containing protein, partial [Planctomycetota bacterium]
MRRLTVNDRELGELGLLVIDSAPNGSATGGVRAVESLAGLDLPALARIMTRKYALLPFPRNGGAKAAVVIPLDASPEERRTRLRAFGRALGPLIRSRTYRPWTDLRTTTEDLGEVYAAAGVAAPPTGSSAFYTAYSVAGAGLAACDRLGVAPAAATAVIHGLGRIGTELAMTLDRLGVRVLAVANRYGSRHDAQGLRVPELVVARAAEDERWLGGPGPETLFALPCDLFFACADAQSIDAPAAEALAARAVVPAANEPCAEGAAQILARRGVLLLPDFVVNSGGILGSFLAGFGLARDRLARFE